MNSNQKETLVNNAIEAIHKPLTWVGIGMVFLSLGWMVNSISSCSAESDKARFQYNAESSKSFWERNKTNDD